MSNIITKQEVTTNIDADGNESTTIKETTTNFKRNEEPDYIKIYTKMWLDFNQIPLKWHELFMQLALRMSYTNSSNEQSLKESQTVVVYGPISESITKACGWKDKSTLRKGLKALCDCGAIRNVGRAMYQINPNYASRGSWKYNPKLNQGGVEDLIATFSFADKSVKTKIIWADDGSDTDDNIFMREGLGVSKADETILKTREVS